jgi:hypothetical protein
MSQTAELNMQGIEFKIGDRVSQKDIEGPVGTIRQIREETKKSAARASGKEGPGVTVQILWDNGTLSHLIPENLEKK